MAGSLERSVGLAGILLTIAIGACGPAGPAQPASAPSGPGGEAPRTIDSGKTLVLMTRAEPDSLAGTTMVPGTTSTGSRRRLFNAGLTLRDGDNRPLPYLAESLPQLNSDTWRVLPDGRMETTYRLRPNLVWHDGQPLSADDFVFAWQVYATPQFGQAGTEPMDMIQEVAAPDPRTVLIRWRGAYAEAGALEAAVSTGVPTGGPSFSPLPRHARERAYLEQKIIHLAKTLTEQVGVAPLYFTPWVLALPSAIQGINQRAADADQVWNIHEWELRG